MSPVRLEIAEALRLLGTASIAEVAGVLNRPADALYRHFRQLMAAMFVKEAGVRKNGRNLEMVYELAAEDFVVDFSAATRREANEAIHQATANLMRATERAVRDASAMEEIDPTGGNFSLNYELSWLTAADFKRAGLLVAQLKELMDKGKRKGEGKLYLSFAVITPVNRKRGAKPDQPKVRVPRSTRAG
jgi:hypothetical protein